eukprot:11187707-Lingulodinium_polyedra.AAC.1
MSRAVLLSSRVATTRLALRSCLANAPRRSSRKRSAVPRSPTTVEWLAYAVLRAPVIWPTRFFARSNSRSRPSRS